MAIIIHKRRLKYYINRSTTGEYFPCTGVGGSDPADGVFILALTGRRVHIDDQRFDTQLCQGHGGGDPHGTGADYDDVI